MSHICEPCQKLGDPVNRPPHYLVGGYECLDIIEALELNYRIGNALKYIWRAGRKNDALQDLKKARFYLDREIKDREATCRGE